MFRCVVIFIVQAIVLMLLVTVAFFGYSQPPTLKDNQDVPGVLKYALKYGEERQKVEEGKSTAEGGREKATVSIRAAGKNAAQEMLPRQRLRQQDVMLEQLRRENRQLREKSEKWETLTADTQAQRQQMNGLLAQVETLKKQLKEAQQKQQTDDWTQAALTAQLASMPATSPDELAKDEASLDYAAGVMVGQELLIARQFQSLLGVKTNSRVLLAGVRDAVNHQVQLNPQALQQALAALEARIQKARTKTIAVEKLAGEKFIQTFSKEKGVRKDERGFWYRLDYAGDGASVTGDDALVEVVVTEKRADGVVVEDMEAGARTLSMALGDYPPLFRNALLLMKNHGSMTLVAPPELAYGDEGYPPKVPPGATMVYTLRVENVGTQEKGNTPEARINNIATNGRDKK